MIKLTVETNACYTSSAGVARYVRGLLKGLRRVDPADLAVSEFAWPVENLDFAQPRRALKTAYRELVWAPFVAPRLLRRSGCDLLHMTTSLPLRTPEALPWVQTVYDCAVFRHPDRFRRWHVFSSRLYSRRALQANRLICISRFVADELIQLRDADPNKIDVVYLGSDFAEEASAMEAKPPDRPIPESFFFFLGSLEPGKNLSLLRESYEQAARRGVELPPLVIIGARWARVPGEGPPPKNWIYLGRQPDEVLLYCYRRALALVFPSRYEGFGLPVLEAMSVGCPVICSRVASLPEVGGDAACYVEQTPEAYLNAMAELAKDDRARTHLRERGVVQARKFSWTRCAEETLQVYRSLIGA